MLLTYQGAILPRSELNPEVTLSLAELRLMAAIAVAEPVDLNPIVEAIATASGVERASLELLLDRLDERGLMTHEPAPVWSDAPFSDGSSPAAVLIPAEPIHDALVVGKPRTFALRDGKFHAYDHSGAVLVSLTPELLRVASLLVTEPDLVAAKLAYDEPEVAGAPTTTPFEWLASHLLHLGILRRASDEGAKGRAQALLEQAIRRAATVWDTIDAGFQNRLAEALETDEAQGRQRIPVVPIETQHASPPLSLGMIVSYARGFEGGRLDADYAFLPSSFMNADRLARVIERNAIFLFSDYIWSSGDNLEISHQLKTLNPRCLMIHGGPDAPKYQGDVDEFFETNPFVDIVVHGEGEVTFAEMLAALAPSLLAGEADLTALDDVAGLSYRTPTGPVRTADRDRLTDVNVIPSPFLTGIYDAHRGGGIDTAFIETNRGCPYGCTYCDWGSSTASRIRKFDLDRVFAELEWCAQASVSQIYVCDANFGILERDVEIAQKVADLKREYGFPRTFQTNYAKNTVKHLQKIVSILAAEGIVTEGLLSLQSMDDDTLKTIRRSNIKVEKYDSLAVEFRRAELPLMVDLMIGLPGSTTASVREDFQQCIDREINAKVFQTESLVNSPMNDPVYRKEHAIVTERADGTPAERVARRGSARGGRTLVVSSSSFTREDYNEMLALRRVFLIAENFAVLRLVSRFIRQELGIRESDFLEQLRVITYTEADRWPAISAAVRHTPEYMVAPASWRAFIDEIGAYLVERLGITPSSALDTVLTAQHAVLPAPGRQFPFVVDLAHDVGAWYGDVLRTKDGGMRTNWTDSVARLETYPPTRFVVEDPNSVCEVGMGFMADADPYADWELTSPVRRLHANHHADQVVDEAS